MINNSDFLTSVIGYISPIGSQDDPKGREGLAFATSKSYDYGTKTYPDSNRLFIELEKLGAQFSQFAGKQEVGLIIRAPKDNIDKAQLLLNEIINNPVISAESVDKIKKSQLMDINDIELDDTSYAINELTKLVLNEEDELGSSQTVSRITKSEIEDFHKKISENHLKLKVDGAENYKIFKDSKLKYIERKINSRSKIRVRFLNKKLEQKVLCLGFRTKGFNDYNFATRLVAQKILYDGLGGLIPKIIRTDNHAAYYAYGLLSIQKEKGMYYVCAGISEANLIKVINLTFDILKNITLGNFDESRLHDAKKSSLGEVDQLFDSISRLFSFYSTRILMNAQIPDYQSLRDTINNVNLQQIIDFYKSIFQNNLPYLTINGEINEKIQKECTELINK